MGVRESNVARFKAWCGSSEGKAFGHGFWIVGMLAYAFSMAHDSAGSHGGTAFSVGAALGEALGVTAFVGLLTFIVVKIPPLSDTSLHAVVLGAAMVAKAVTSLLSNGVFPGGLRDTGHAGSSPVSGEFDPSQLMRTIVRDEADKSTKGSLKRCEDWADGFRRIAELRDRNIPLSEILARYESAAEPNEANAADEKRLMAVSAQIYRQRLAPQVAAQSVLDAYYKDALSL